MRIGPYEVLNELGRGGAGVVYRVRTPQGSEAALKLLVKNDPQAFARFDRERRLQDTLGEEEGFVRLLDARSSAEGAWLLMPFIPGGTLRARLEAGPLGIEETISLGIEVAAALGRAHERGIVHRDVKPENILFSDSGRPLVADMGLAKHWNPLMPGASQSAAISRSGVVKGTAGYMAPEQLKDARTVGPQSDVFALGAVLHECLAGRPAFEGENLVEVLAKVSSATAGPIGRPGTPAWIEAAIRRALARDPADRFRDGAAMARALDRRHEKADAPKRSLLWLGSGVAAGAIVLGGWLAMRGAARPQATAPPAAPRRAPAPPPAVPALADEKGDRDAIADATKTELVPGLAADWVNRGIDRGQRGDFEGAIADLTRAIELDPTLAAAWANRGYARSQRGDPDGAIVDETKAIELDPGSPNAYLIRGSARGLKGDPDGVIVDETKALELDPTLTNALSERGRARGIKGDLDGAFADFSKALEINPRFAGAWANRGTARKARGDLEGAISDFSKALELDPGIAAVWLERGSARGQRGDLDGEIADETKAIEVDPRTAESWDRRAKARGNKGDNDGMMADFSKALELGPRVATAWTDRGAARARAGDLDGALADFSKGIELDPRLATAWKNRGLVRKMKGELRGAIADVERALELDPAAPDAGALRAWLEDARKK